MPNFSKELDDAEQRDAAARSFSRLKDWQIKDGETHYLRLVSVRPVTVDVHRFIPTKDKPKDCEWTKWPSMMWAVCQLDKGFRLVDEQGNMTDDFEEGYGDCYIHTAMAGVIDPKFGKDKSVPEVMTYGIAAVRQLVYDQATKLPVGFTDKTIEAKDKSGNVHTIPELVIVGQKYGQFWSAVNAANFLPPRDMRRMDFQVVRKENDLKVNAQPIMDDLVPGKPSWDRYEKAVEITGADLEAYIIEHSTPDHYAKFFVPGAVPKGGYGKGASSGEESAGAASSQPATTVTPEVSQSELDALRADLNGRAPQDASQS